MVDENTELQEENNQEEPIIHETISKKCSMRIFRDEEEMNPNNYDIYLSIGDIPANIKKENLSELKYRLQRAMPASKKIHLNLLDSFPRSLGQENRLKINNQFRIGSVKNLTDSVTFIHRI